MSQIKAIITIVSILLFVSNCLSAQDESSLLKSNLTSYKESSSANSYVQTIILRFSSPQKDKLTKVEVAETIKTTGYLKGNKGFSPRNNHAHYTVKVTDGSGNPIFETEIEDPLDKTMEYIQDDGELMKKQALLEEDFVAIRMNFEEAAQFLEIYHEHQLIAKAAL